MGKIANNILLQRAQIKGSLPIDFSPWLCWRSHCQTNREPAQEALPLPSSLQPSLYLLSGHMSCWHTEVGACLTVLPTGASYFGCFNVHWHLLPRRFLSLGRPAIGLSDSSQKITALSAAAGRIKAERMGA